MALIYLYFVLAILVAIIAAIRGRASWRWFLIAMFLTPLIAGLLVMVLPKEPQVSEFSDEYSLAAENEAAPTDCTIRIIRLSSYWDRHRPYQIYVNGLRVGSILRDRVVDFQVPCGELVIEALTGRGGSRPMLIEAAPEHIAEIEISSQGGLLAAIWAATFGSDSYLTLRKRSEDGRC